MGNVLIFMVVHQIGGNNRCLTDNKHVGNKQCNTHFLFEILGRHHETC